MHRSSMIISYSSARPLTQEVTFHTDFPGTTISITDFVIYEEKIFNIIRSLNLDKAHGWEEISVRMIKMSNDA